MDTVGRNKEQIAEYIRKQIKEDYSADQLTLFEEVDPFRGVKNKKRLSEILLESASRSGAGGSFQRAF